MNHQTKPIIYIEATALTRHTRTGVDYVAEGLIGELVQLSPDVDFILFYFAHPQAELRLKAKNVRAVVITKMSSRFYRLLLLLGVAPSVEWLTGEKNIRTVIFPDFVAWPIRTKEARIFPYVHDTSYLDTPEYASKKLRRFLHTLVARSIKVASKVLVNSRATQRAVMQHYSVSKSKLAVLYPGAPNPVTPAKIKLPQKFILFVGTLEPRKNIANLIRAHAQLPTSLREEYPLLLAGKKGWLDEEIQSLIQEYADKGVVPLGYVDEATREELYRSATIFVYPSLYEGFGMPVIEAQMHGVPVITTRSSSLPEAGGKAAYYTDSDPVNLASAMQALLTQPSLRKKLSALGRTHAATFTWKRSAQELQKLLGIR